MAAIRSARSALESATDGDFAIELAVKLDPSGSTSRSGDIVSGART